MGAMNVVFCVVTVLMVVCCYAEAQAKDIERQFIPMSYRSSSNRYCCSEPPYNVTTQHTYTKESRERFVATDRIVTGVRFACPNKLFYPDRPTLEDCQYYDYMTRIAYRSVTRLATRLITQEYYCRPEDLTECCEGLIRYNENCYTRSEYQDLMRMLGGHVQSRVTSSPSNTPQTAVSYERATTERTTHRLWRPRTSTTPIPTTRRRLRPHTPPTTTPSERTEATNPEQASTTTVPPTPPQTLEPRIEQVFIPHTRPTDPRFCCRTDPYNVTSQHTYTEDESVAFVNSRQIIAGIRTACPGPRWPYRRTVESCYYYTQQTFMDTRTVPRQVTRLTTQEYYCRTGDLTECCQGYVKYNDACLSLEDYNALLSLMSGQQFGK